MAVSHCTFGVPIWYLRQGSRGPGFEPRCKPEPVGVSPTRCVNAPVVAARSNEGTNVNWLVQVRRSMPDGERFVMLDLSTQRLGRHIPRLLSSTAETVPTTTRVGGVETGTAPRLIEVTPRAYAKRVNHKDPVLAPALQREYRIRIALFLAGVLVFAYLASVVYTGTNTIARLDVVEADRDRWQKPSDVIEELKLKDGDVVADIGSGAGYFDLKLSGNVGRSGKVLAVDIRRLPLAFLWIRAVLRGQRNVHVQVGDPDDPHLPVGTVDAVLVANTYHEFTNPESMVDHIFKSLRRGGRLVVLDRSSVGGEAEEERNHHEIAPDHVDKQLRQRGFAILDRQDQFIERPTGERWWMITAQKARQ